MKGWWIDNGFNWAFGLCNIWSAVKFILNSVFGRSDDRVFSYKLSLINDGWTLVINL